MRKRKLIYPQKSLQHYLSQIVKQLKIQQPFQASSLKKSQRWIYYTASENNFQVSKFHDKCDGKQHTITFLKTEFSKVIGGYTPLPWKKSKILQYSRDVNMQSFIFSLTNKNKLKLIEGKKDKAIYHHCNAGPLFGSGRDLGICDKADVNRYSCAKPGDTYNYNNEYKDTQQFYKRWSGQSTGYQFKIQEWQVYSVSFEV